MSIEKEEFREILHELLDERARIDACSHAEHHEWIQERIEKDKALKEFYRETTKMVIQWSVPVVLGAAYYWLHEHLK